MHVCCRNALDCFHDKLIFTRSTKIVRSFRVFDQVIYRPKSKAQNMYTAAKVQLLTTQ